MLASDGPTMTGSLVCSRSSTSLEGGCQRSDGRQQIGTGSGLALFGLVLGSLLTYLASNIRQRRAVERGRDPRQVQVPSSDDQELI